MTVYTIPLATGPQTASVSISGKAYQLRLIYAAAANGEGGWLLDISGQGGAPIVCGIPLVTGADLFEQYPHLGLPGKLFVSTAGDLSAPPTFEGLGTTSTLSIEV